MIAHDTVYSDTWLCLSVHRPTTTNHFSIDSMEQRHARIQNRQRPPKFSIVTSKSLPNFKYDSIRVRRKLELWSCRRGLAWTQRPIYFVRLFPQVWITRHQRVTFSFIDFINTLFTDHSIFALRLRLIPIERIKSTNPLLATFWLCLNLSFDN